MASVRFSNLATSDLLAIALFSQQKWGEIQAKKYIGELHQCCALLSANPLIGRPATLGRWACRRIEQGSHVVFYREARKGIFVQRILHKNMQWNMHKR